MSDHAVDIGGLARHLLGKIGQLAQAELRRRVMQRAEGNPQAVHIVGANGVAGAIDLRVELLGKRSASAVNSAADRLPVSSTARAGSITGRTLVCSADACGL